jgi:molybdate transport system substrate-binding protein
MMTTLRSIQPRYNPGRRRGATLAPVKVLLALVAAAACSSKSHGRTVRVAAASDLARAFEELGKAFEAKTGITPEIDINSSGWFAKQIEHGAPYALFASANRAYVDQVLAAGRCDPASAKLYSRGRLVVWTRGAAPVKLSDLAEERFAKIAIANPDHAPYGAAAKAALETAKLWDQLQPKMVLAEDVQTAMTYARSGSVDASIVALSLAVVTDGGAFLAVDPSLYPPLEQTMVVCGNGADSDAARQLEQYILSRDGREIMTRYGFTLDSK